MKTLSFQLDLRGHTYIAIGISDRDQLADVVSDWCKNPELDFGLEDSIQSIKQIGKVPQARKLISSWPRCS